ncbi:flagellar export protein FliJ [Morganella morganii]|uniref:Flagellar FliJ protein n=1 Tax=Morganella morganii TaxID=582 RepID=A0AAN5MIK8_MORMO|nr:flagella biosynthesis chaperone FliJ [Salmonella enterica subsp. enterica serovar Newport]HAT3810681.1 flagella biosynthesis chaperone FliJ [Morganella morganii]
MNRHDPMDVLRDLADKKLTDTTNHLGKMRQEYAHANNQLTSLENYEQEYQQQMQSGMTDKGMTVIELLSHQSFIASLGKVINHQKHQVELCQHSVDNAVGLWHKDKQRLNAFDTLKQRAEVARVMQENRRDQKLMDEFAQRVTRRNT